MRACGRVCAALILAACVSDAGGPGTNGPAGPSGGAMPRPAPIPTEPVAWRPAAPSRMARLIGLDEATLQLQLGEPELRRREPPAEVWRYVGMGCTLHLFLYLGSTGVYRVVHAEARPSEAGDDCVKHLIEEYLPRPRPS